MADWNSNPADAGLTDAGNGNGQKPGTRNAEETAKAIAKGWAEGEKINYAAYSANPTTSAVSDIPTPPWACNAQKYEYHGEEGDVGPEMPELEHELFGSELRLKKGIQFDQ